MPQDWKHLNHMPLKERFNLRICNANNGCIEWVGSKNKGGYGFIGIEGKATYVHRYSYEKAYGPIPEGLQIDHLCRNRACVNPEHLRAVPQVENLMCGESLFAKNARKDRCVHGHIYTPENTYWYKRLDKYGGGTQRKCRECERRRARNNWRNRNATVVKEEITR